MKLPAWLTYTLLRVSLILVVLLVLLWLGIHPLPAALISAVVAMTLSYIFLSRPRNNFSASIYTHREKEEGPDAAVEDPEADYENQLLDNATDQKPNGNKDRAE